MPVQNNPFIQAIRDAGFKVTPQRIAVCDWLYRNNTHPTAADVYEALREAFPTMSLATVYSTLEVLEALKLIYPVGMNTDGSKRYDTVSRPHVNLVCRHCGRVIDVAGDRMLDEARRSVASYGFEAQDINVVVYGFCADCREPPAVG
jgi:Fur family peroxide stress response transcriptional regulator